VYVPWILDPEHESLESTNVTLYVDNCMGKLFNAEHPVGIMECPVNMQKIRVFRVSGFKHQIWL